MSVEFHSYPRGHFTLPSPFHRRFWRIGGTPFPCVHQYPRKRSGHSLQGLPPAWPHKVGSASSGVCLRIPLWFPALSIEKAFQKLGSCPSGFNAALKRHQSGFSMSAFAECRCTLANPPPASTSTGFAPRGRLSFERSC